MNSQLLITTIVQQTMVFIAQLATAGGVRAPLARVADDVFLGLTRELGAQGLKKKVIADMFGMGLRTYHRRVQSLEQSKSFAGKTVWEAVLEFVQQNEPVTTARILERFAHDDTEIEGGQVTESVPLSSSETPVGAFGPDGSLYLASAAGVSQVVAGAVTPLLGTRPFDPAAEFAWRRQAFGRTLAEPSRDVGREALANPSPEMIGVKVHVQGVAFAAYESTGVVVDGRELPSTWAEPADQVSTFLRERGQSALFELPETRGGPIVDPASAPLSDLYGYLEAGTCFGWASTRQFWLVEAYPTDMTPTEREGLAEDLRARYPAPPQ